MPSEAVAGPSDVLRVAVWQDGKVRESTGAAEVADVLATPGPWTWIDVTSPSAATVGQIAAILGLHPLIAEDILEGNQRPKIEVTDQLVHLVAFAVRYGEGLDATEVDFVLGDRFLLSAHGPNWEPRASHQLRGGLAPIMAKGPDHLLWALLDNIVDNYFPCMDRVGDEIDALEDDVINQASRAALQRLFVLKRDLIAMRRSISPMREIFNQLTNRDLALIDREEIIYFRDVYDHLIRITDELDTHRELVSGTLEVYLTTVNNNLSLIMKRLTGVTVILAGVGAVAGIFGMSEATAEAGGFWLVTAAIGLLAGAAAIFLRRIDWL